MVLTPLNLSIAFSVPIEVPAILTCDKYKNRHDEIYK
jgi:hypothetical protein